MRLKRLCFEAFGPFTEEVLDLRGGAPGGLHLIYGPNEAGKSTSLRAVSALLFGMPHQSVDAHLHPSADLRVSAVLEKGGGSAASLRSKEETAEDAGVGELSVTRLKRRKDSLVDPQGRPLPEDVLVPYLGGLDQRSFEARFGLDQSVLEEGARALLGGSEEGIFSAGTAGARAGQLLGELDAEMAALFRPRGQKYRLNVALSRLAEAEKAAWIAERPPEKWQEQKRAYEKTKKRVEQLEREQNEVRRELGRLSRLASVLTEVSYWVDAEEELRGLSDVPPLADDAPARRHQVLSKEREAEVEARSHRQELARLETRLEELPQPSSIVDVDEERIALIRNQIGSELKARGDLPKRRGKLSALEDEVNRLLRQLGRPEASVEETLIDAPLERRIATLSTQHGSIASEVQQLRRSVSRLDGELEQLQQGEDEEDFERLVGEIQDLQAAALKAREVQPQTGRCEELRGEVEAAQKKSQELRERLPLSGAKLRSPDAEQLETLLRAHQQLVGQEQRLRDREVAARANQQRAEAQAKALQEAFELPTEQQLLAERAKRDEIMDRLRGAAEGRDELLERLPGAIDESDRIADRLRREAQRISELAALRQEALSQEAELFAVREATRQHDKEWAQFEENFGELFRECGVATPEVTAARPVARRIEEVLSLEQVAARQRSELEVLGKSLEEAREQLHELLPRVGRQPSLQHLIDEAERAVEEHRERQIEAKNRTKQLRKQKRRREEEHKALTEAEEGLRTWKTQWAEAMRKLGQSPSATPEEIQSYLSGLSQLSRAVDEMNEMRRRVEGIERDTRSFVELLQGIARHHATDLLNADPIEAAEALLARVRDAQEAQRERKRLVEEIERRRAQEIEARERVDAARAELKELMNAAGVTDWGDLAEVEEKAARKRVLRQQLQQLEGTLRQRAGGGSVQKLVEQVRDLDHDELRANIIDLENRQEEVDEELGLARREADGQWQGLERFRTEDAAAARQRLEGRRAEVSHALREYLVLRAARVLLGAEVERYAAAHQGPILARADELFRRLTLGRYTGLRVGLGEHVLRCVREGKDVEVEGLSRGTRSQLYLALRLASLERHFQNHGPVPLVLDDLFVDFDDDRAAAAFEILGELSSRTQILYYTHLARDVEAADAAVPRGQLFLHKLNEDG